MGKNIDELAAAERREYQRKWRADNRDRVKKHQSDYWKRRAAKKLQGRDEGGK